MLTPAEFRTLHRPGDPLLLPNAWDLASTRWLAAAGHRAIGTTSLGLAFGAGRRDGAGEIAAETFALAQAAAAVGIALSVDLEAGFSDDPDEVGRFAAELAAIGCVGVNLEDSTEHGELADPELAAAKVAAIAAAAPGLYLNARTDGYWIDGDADADARFTDAVARSGRYLAAGASGVFVPGVLDPATIAALAGAIEAPLNVLVQPELPFSRLAELGVARVSTGSLLFRISLGSITGAVGALVGDGVPTSTLPAAPSYAEVAGLRPTAD
ncbi:2-methylisocitrate lyase-like PEP mutase family enzyme [Agromyces hippuratus]|uniref:2-methylisocitrate lyase-like PEP mutase family enzyme n=1 Tax=Agromyces hippuratus TaxID=286438 RepID=A0A852WPL5_9MICO|nr:isocitrate lyase/phosphoenolpyruvate mutase family protein [Agromyces hippuratus]NYG19677.1 2-methylisocitrate lyase-like PEP mutase family enzyme [Agromyces hippuratus]